MKLTKVFLLCCLSQIVFLFFSCSSDSDADGIAEEEIINAEENFIEVLVNRQSFKPDDVTVNSQDNYINIVGTETSSNRSVF